MHSFKRASRKRRFAKLLDLRSKDNSIIHDFYACHKKYVTYTSASIQNNLLEIVAGHIRDQILAEVRSAEVFGIIFDLVDSAKKIPFARNALGIVFFLKVYKRTIVLR